MSKNLSKVLISPVLLGMTFVAAPAMADTASTNELLNQVNQYSAESQSLDQVNNVFQLRDVSPSDWAFDALRNLVDRYNCLQGYPDRTYRGNRPLTRYEFAAGLNACMAKLEAMIAGGEDVDPNDLASMRRMMKEFEAELASLGARVDDLEGRTKFLEDHQFSTTTKLKGEVIVGLTDTFGSNDTNQTVLGNRARLALETSFTGKDKLVTRLAAGNLGAFDVSTGGTGTPATTQTFNLAPNGTNGVAVDWLAYYFPINKSVDAYIAAAGGLHTDYVARTLNPGFEDFGGGNGALSVFASSNPIYQVGGGAGAGLTFKNILPSLFKAGANFSAGYLADQGNNPLQGRGLTNGDYSILTQLDFNLGRDVALGLTYANAYHTLPNAGTGYAGNAAFDGGAGTSIVGALPTPPDATVAGVNGFTSNSYGAEATIALGKKVDLNFFGTLSKVTAGASRADVTTYGGGLAFKDFGKKGNLLGLFAGVQPYVNSTNIPGTSTESPFHIEGFYRYKLNDNISITPGIIYISKPDGNVAGENSTTIGTIRTTFTF